MTTVAWILACWGCLALGVVFGHLLWPRPEQVRVLVEAGADTDEIPVVRGRHAALTREIPAVRSPDGRA